MRFLLGFTVLGFSAMGQAVENAKCTTLALGTCYQTKNVSFEYSLREISPSRATVYPVLDAANINDKVDWFPKSVDVTDKKYVGYLTSPNYFVQKEGGYINVYSKHVHPVERTDLAFDFTDTAIRERVMEYNRSTPEVAGRSIAQNPSYAGQRFLVGPATLKTVGIQSVPLDQSKMSEAVENCIRKQLDQFSDLLRTAQGKAFFKAQGKFKVKVEVRQMNGFGHEPKLSKFKPVTSMTVSNAMINPHGDAENFEVTLLPLLKENGFCEVHPSAGMSATIKAAIERQKTAFELRKSVDAVVDAVSAPEGDH